MILLVGQFTSRFRSQFLSPHALATPFRPACTRAWIHFLEFMRAPSRVFNSLLKHRVALCRAAACILKAWHSSRSIARVPSTVLKVVLANTSQYTFSRRVMCMLQCPFQTMKLTLWCASRPMRSMRMWHPTALLFADTTVQKMGMCCLGENRVRVLPMLPTAALQVHNSLVSTALGLIRMPIDLRHTYDASGLSGGMWMHRKVRKQSCGALQACAGTLCGCAGNVMHACTDMPHETSHGCKSLSLHCAHVEVAL